MNTLAASEIKRRGIGAVDSLLAGGPVHIIKNNIPNYVIISEENYQRMLNDLAENRLAASDADIKAGRVRKGTLKQLIKEIEA